MSTVDCTVLNDDSDQLDQPLYIETHNTTNNGQAIYTVVQQQNYHPPPRTAAAGSNSRRFYAVSSTMSVVPNEVQQLQNYLHQDGRGVEQITYICDDDVEDIVVDIAEDKNPMWRLMCPGQAPSEGTLEPPHLPKHNTIPNNGERTNITTEEDEPEDEIARLRRSVGTGSRFKRARLVAAVNDDDVTQSVVIQGSSHLRHYKQPTVTASVGSNMHRQLSGNRAGNFKQTPSSSTAVVSSSTSSSSGRRGRRPLQNNKFKCDHCSASYRQRRNLLRHLSSAHDARDQVVNMYCLVPGCGYGCVHVDQLRRHLEEGHGVNITEETHNFKSMEEFKEWRYQYQKDNNVSYVISTGKQKNKDGSTVFYYNCSRSGRYKSQARLTPSVQRYRVVPTQKLGGYCPSTMKVLVYCDGQVQCTLWPIHYFHDLDVSHIQNLRLQRRDREVIADRLKAGKTSTDIIQEFTSNINIDNPTRLNFICRKDIVNVRIAYSLPPSPTIYNRGRPRKNQWSGGSSSHQNSSHDNLVRGHNSHSNQQDESEEECDSDVEDDVTVSDDDLDTEERDSGDLVTDGGDLVLEQSEGDFCINDDGHQIDISEEILNRLPVSSTYSQQSLSS